MAWPWVGYAGRVEPFKRRAGKNPPSPPRTAWLGLPGLVLLLAGSRLAFAGPILHEPLPPNAAEDLAFQATTSDGELPAAIQTRAGAVAVPAAGTATSATTYGGENHGASGYRLDNNTVGPASVRYSEPFTPSIVPYKRWQVFDAVAPDMELIVRSDVRIRLPVGGVSSARDDQFYGDMTVDLIAGRDVKIPSVAAGARILSVRLTPPVAVEFHRDSAENWFVRAQATQRVRLVMHLAVDRAAFGARYGNATWHRLARELPGLPAEVLAAGRRVASSIGVSQQLRPRIAVERLIKYFRAFNESEQRPTTSGIELYESIALSQIGVCRHRAFAFAVTAMAVGIPVRFVLNEAHAWVEVSDGYRWGRVDLGGAAAQLRSESRSELSVHSPPADPYGWPPGSYSGRNMAQAERTARGSRTAQGRAGVGAAAAAAAPSGSPVPRLSPVMDPVSKARAALPRSEMSVTLETVNASRGSRIRVFGEVRSGYVHCPSVRVDVVLTAPGLQPLQLGALVTDASGHYDGFVLVPGDVEVGDYDVQVRTPGSSECGQGNSNE